MKTCRRFLTIFLVFLTIGFILVLPASAATNFGALSTAAEDYFPFTCYASSNSARIDVYKDANASHKMKGYWVDSYEAQEQLVVEEINKKTAKVIFLTDRKKAKIGWIKLTDLFGSTEISPEAMRTTANVSVVRMRSSKATCSYGSIYKDSDVMVLGARKVGGIKYRPVLYRLSNAATVNGKKINYKLGLVKDTICRKYMKPLVDPTGLTIKGAESIKLTGKGDTTQLTAVLTPGNATGKVSWCSSNKKVATVDSSGLVISTGTGSCCITASVAVNKKGYTHIYADSIKLSVNKETTQKVVCPVKDPTISANISRGWGDYASERSERQYHLGLDYTVRLAWEQDKRFFSKLNLDVRAFCAGKVVDVGYDEWNGYFITIKHTFDGRSYYSFYGHLDGNATCVTTGQKVSAGQKISKMSRSGRGAGNNIHLHFAITDRQAKNGSYYGYSTKFTGNQRKCNGVVFYNPKYVLSNNGKLPN